MTKVKTSIRLALTDFLRDAFEVLKRTRYPFMKEDEILKLALSQLYAAENIPSSKQTTVSFIMAKMRANDPSFGKAWLKQKNLQEENMDATMFCEMLVDILNAKK